MELSKKVEVGKAIHGVLGKHLKISAMPLLMDEKTVVLLSRLIGDFV
ncbi:hypothetical protein Q5O24_01770 [Eubacteriaceae bacterium ES3]|nr:hypothetical protein Q5O24_01770 [Eubacteriaceae bacterium ES3]